MAGSLFNPLHTATSILIRASREQIFEVVRDLARWPERLPHYRFIRFLGKEPGGRDLVRMSARRGPIPVTWQSAYEADPATLELRFEHLRAWTKGMLVVWTLTPTRDGTRVEIVHDLKFRIPALAWFAEPIINHFFIEPIARKTLATFKDVIEAAAAVDDSRRMPDAER
jgi:ribosome-associated toxin RatA of RatAB toxin-antitoxin module